MGRRRAWSSAFVAGMGAWGLTSCGAFGTADGAADAGSATDAGAIRDEVDAGAEAATPPGSCRGDAGCPRYVFVTSDAYAGVALASAVEADAKCTAEAAQGDPVLAGRMYNAWLSDDVSQANVRLTHGTMPYRLADSTVIANDWKDLTKGALRHAIDLDEQKVRADGGLVWTGTTVSGDKTAETCTSKTDPHDYSAVGRSDALDQAWTNRGNDVDCRQSLRLYCIEQ